MVMTDRIGRVEEEEALYDLLSVILIRRGGECTEEGIYEYLDGIFKGNKSLIEKYSNVTWSSKMTGEVERMSGLGEAIMEQAMQRGLEQGLQQGRELVYCIVDK